MDKKKRRAGFLFVLPWIIGILLFTLIPMIAALYIGFTDWTIIGNAKFIGLKNYQDIFKNEDFYQALWVTVRYAIFAIPLTIITSLVISIFLSKNRKGVGIYRVIYYMPAIVSGVAVAIVFKWILDPTNGLLNSILAIFKIKGPDWLYDANWVLPSYLIMAVWGAGGGILTYLAALKDVPQDLYESASIDGANNLQKIWHITIPMLTPIIFYNLVIGIISAFRKFTDAYVLGGIGKEGNFYMIYLYDRAFSQYEMGYATALAWILFAIILALTLIVNITKKYWVFKAE
ncbi:MAG: sugar ABC transporter permease [Acholeplasmatales bacterium]|jgi:multiple sugar transport system permease protein|nr:sugar ABC transporter permease [Acholeplasmataceae bacterium]MDY0115039.1 sugar ABC transporter permease [Acholeplasmatales bacterium]MCK9233854.1 sugar ABC transporter permease [Acholeplasmataceae bacterium]MCK9289377.1 sugar ABC transporter permease [Acholeplasmataceae bacterium]MCK9428074.1 sugar ABC transporter permease [Acholeplasmataceae bacterium]